MTQLLGRLHAQDYCKTLGFDAAMAYLRTREDNARPEYLRGYVDAMLERATEESACPFHVKGEPTCNLYRA